MLTIMYFFLLSDFRYGTKGTIIFINKLTCSLRFAQ